MDIHISEETTKFAQLVVFLIAVNFSHNCKLDVNFLLRKEKFNMSPILYKFQNNYFKNKYLNHWRKWTFENLLISRCLKSVKWPKIELKLLPLIYCIDMKKVPVFSVKFLVTLTN